MSESKKLIESWGGKMYLIYFPTCASIKYNNNYDLMDKKIKNIINQLNIPLIDLKQKVFNTHTDPMSLFPFRSCAHYNASGYNAVANAIVKRLDQDSVFK